MTTDSRRRALIDTDPGIDDALALLLAWGSPEWTVDVVTVVAGNAPLEACARNVFACSTCAGRCPRRLWRPARHGRWRGRCGPPRTTAATARRSAGLAAVSRESPPSTHQE